MDTGWGLYTRDVEQQRGLEDILYIFFPLPPPSTLRVLKMSFIIGSSIIASIKRQRAFRPWTRRWIVYEKAAMQCVLVPVPSIEMGCLRNEEGSRKGKKNINDTAAYRR